MGSSFNLSLDTTSPNLEIFMPITVMNAFDVPITISASEIIGDVVELYILDSFFYRHNLIFQKVDTELLGLVRFNLPIGQATLYCRVTDTVGNESGLLVQSFNVVNVIPIDADVEIKTGNTLINVNEMSIVSGANQMSASSGVEVMNVDFEIKEMSAEISAED